MTCCACVEKACSGVDVYPVAEVQGEGVEVKALFWEKGMVSMVVLGREGNGDGNGLCGIARTRLQLGRVLEEPQP